MKSANIKLLLSSFFFKVNGLSIDERVSILCISEITHIYGDLAMEKNWNFVVDELSPATVKINNKLAAENLCYRWLSYWEKKKQIKNYQWMARKWNGIPFFRTRIVDIWVTKKEKFSFSFFRIFKKGEYSAMQFAGLHIIDAFVQSAWSIALTQC